MAVILQGKLGHELHFEESADPEEALFALVEKTTDAAEVVLVPQVLWELYSEDPDLQGSLQLAYSSEDLPHDLLVIFGDHPSALAAETLSTTVTAMNDDEEGKQVLQSIRVARFAPIDQERLERARQLFDGKQSVTIE